MTSSTISDAIFAKANVLEYTDSQLVCTSQALAPINFTNVAHNGHTALDSAAAARKQMPKTRV